MTSTRRSLTVLGALAAMLAASTGVAHAQQAFSTLGAAPIGFGALRLTWTLAGGHAAGDQYQLRWEENNTGNIIEGPDDDTHILTSASDITALTYTITGLKHGTRYLVNVRARRGATGAWTAWRDNDSGTDGLQAPNGTTQVAPDVPKVTSVTVTAGDGSLMVSWAPVTDGTGAPIARYQWQVTSTSAGGSNGYVDGDVTEAMIRGLTNGVEYTVQVRAQASLNGELDANRTPGAWSDGKKETPVAPPEALGAVTGLTATPGDGMLMVSWTAVANAASYEWEAMGGDATISGSAAGTATEATIRPLVNGTEYTVRVRAKAGEGSERVDGPWASVSGTPEAEAVEPEPQPAPAQVTGLTVTPGDGMLMASWTAVADITGQPIRYQWRVTAAGGYSAMGFSDVAEATIPNLANGTEYTVSVRAHATMDGALDPDRIGDWSSAVRMTPAAAAGPDPDPDPMPTPTPALPLAGVLALFAGLLAAARARLRHR